MGEQSDRLDDNELLGKPPIEVVPIPLNKLERFVMRLPWGFYLAYRLFWLVYARSFHGDSQGDFLAALQREVELEKTQFTGAVLYQGRFAPSTEQQ